jgi:hypothetical protein
MCVLNFHLLNLPTLVWPAYSVKEKVFFFQSTFVEGCVYFKGSWLSKNVQSTLKHNLLTMRGHLHKQCKLLLDSRVGW